MLYNTLTPHTRRFAPYPAPYPPQFGAYLAVLLGTFLPVLFLINLYIQTESRKAGKAGGQDSE